MNASMWHVGFPGLPPSGVSTSKSPKRVEWHGGDAVPAGLSYGAVEIVLKQSLAWGSGKLVSYRRPGSRQASTRHEAGEISGRATTPRRCADVTSVRCNEVWVTWASLWIATNGDVIEHR